MEKLLQFDRMSGLDAERLDELERMAGELLGKPWDKSKGRPRELILREAFVVTSGYMRQNITEEVWAEIFEVDQSTTSRYITFLTPLIDQATAEFRPSTREAAETTRGAITNPAP
ncbi:MAG: transposase family protein [Pseudonocardiaceae bacterium]